MLKLRAISHGLAGIGPTERLYALEGRQGGGPTELDATCSGTLPAFAGAGGGTVHSSCDSTANAGPTRYDEKLCRQSYRLMRDFFDETP
jgi:hypothetical protein